MGQHTVGSAEEPVGRGQTVDAHVGPVLVVVTEEIGQPSFGGGAVVEVLDVP
jgi:hypothetical protein